MELSELKERYEVFVKKYKLPSFDRLNQEFEIERITIESDFLLRAIRKTMMEKIIGWLRFFEMLQNPAGAPRIYHAYFRTMTQEDKQDIDYLYSAFGAINISSLRLEVVYKEKDEANAIIKINEKMQSLQPLMEKIMNHIEKPGNDNIKKDKSYFG